MASARGFGSFVVPNCSAVVLRNRWRLRNVGGGVDNRFLVCDARPDGRWCPGSHRVQLADRRLDPLHGASAGVADDSSLFRSPRRIVDSGSLDDAQLAVCAIGDPLQVGPEIVCESGCFGGHRG